MLSLHSHVFRRKSSMDVLTPWLRRRLNRSHRKNPARHGRVKCRQCHAYISVAVGDEPALTGYLQLDVLLITFGRKTQSAIEELVQQARQFHLAVDFHRAADDSLALEEFLEMFLGHSNCPAEVGKRNPLRGAALTDLKTTLHDVGARLVISHSLKCCKIS